MQSSSNLDSLGLQSIRSSVNLFVCSSVPYSILIGEDLVNLHYCKDILQSTGCNEVSFAQSTEIRLNRHQFVNRRLHAEYNDISGHGR